MLFETLLYFVFVFSAGVLIVVILLQEGRGGGFGQALGEHGQQTFGVGAKGINTFTGYTALVFLVSALVLHRVQGDPASNSAMDEVTIENIMPPSVGGQAPPPGGFGGSGAPGGSGGSGAPGAAGGGGGTPPPDNG